MTAEQTIRTLAKEHGITAEKTELDILADNINRLSDAEVESDEVEMLITHLVHAGILTAKKSMELQIEYLKEKNSGI